MRKITLRSPSLDACNERIVLRHISRKLAQLAVELGSPRGVQLLILEKRVDARLDLRGRGLLRFERAPHRCQFLPLLIDERDRQQIGITGDELERLRVLTRTHELRRLRAHTSLRELLHATEHLAIRRN